MDGCVSQGQCKLCQEKYDEINFGQNKRLEKLEEDIKQIHELVTAVGKMGLSIEHMAEEIKRQGQKLDAIESEPGEKWKKAGWMVISTLIGAGIALMLTKAGM